MKKLLFLFLFILLCGSVQAKTTSVNILFVSTVSSGPSSTILRPTSQGYSDAWDVVGAAEEWAAVDETISDEDSTYIYRTTANGNTSFYSTTTIPTDATVNSVTVNFRGMTTGTGQVRCTTRIGSTTYLTGYITLTGSYADYSCTFTTNPATSAAWTPAEVNVLQWGLASYGTLTGEERVTQCYATISH